MCWLTQDDVAHHNSYWYDNEYASDDTAKDTDPFNYKELLHKPIFFKILRLRKKKKLRCLVSVFVSLCEALKSNQSRAIQWRTLCSVCRAGLPVAVFVLM